MFKKVIQKVLELCIQVKFGLSEKHTKFEKTEVIECSLKALLSCLSFCFKILRAAFVMAFYSLLENDKI